MHGTLCIVKEKNTAVMKLFCILFILSTIRTALINVFKTLDSKVFLCVRLCSIELLVFCCVAFNKMKHIPLECDTSLTYHTIFHTRPPSYSQKKVQWFGFTALRRLSGATGRCDTFRLSQRSEIFRMYQ